MRFVMIRPLRSGPLIVAYSSLASVGKVMFLGSAVIVDLDPPQVLCPQGAALVRHPQALSQKQL